MPGAITRVNEDIINLIFECFDDVPGPESARPLNIDTEYLRARASFFFNCALINRFFHRCSLPHLYRIIAVDQLASQRKVAILELLREPLKKYGQFVWWLTTGSVGLGSFDVVREILPLLPNVRVLNICRTASGLQSILDSVYDIERLSFGIECDAERENLLSRLLPRRINEARTALSGCKAVELDWTIVDSHIFELLTKFSRVKCLTFGSSCKFKTDFSFVDEEELRQEMMMAQKVFSIVNRLTFGMISADKLHMLLPFFDNIKQLDVRFVRVISKDTVRLLSEHCTQLQEFSFYSSSIDKEAIEGLLLRPPPQLQALSMKYLSYNVTGTLLEMVNVHRSAAAHNKLQSISLFGMIPPSLDALQALSTVLPNIRHLGFIMKIEYNAQELAQALVGFRKLSSVYIRRPLFSEINDSQHQECHRQLIHDLAVLLPEVNTIDCFSLRLMQHKNSQGENECVTKTLQQGAIV